MKVAGYVLAGGGSTRFGRDKATAQIDDQPMLLRMKELLANVLSNAVVIAAPEKYASLRVTSIADRWPGEGPLGGIVTALLTSLESSRMPAWNLIVGCDMPFLTREWLTYLVQRTLASEAEVIVPQSAGGLEPLCACWRTSTAATVQGTFQRGVRKISDAMKCLKMEIVDETYWKRFDSAGRLFWNMNTSADYDEARRILKAGHA